MAFLLGVRPVTWAGLVVLAISLWISSPCLAQWTQVPGTPTRRFYSAGATGDTLVAGADTAVYVSTNAGASWQRSARPVATVGAITAVRVHNSRLYAGTYGQGVHVSDDLGATWHPFNEGLVGGFGDSQLDVVDFAVRGDSIFAATAGAGVYVRRLSPAGTWQLLGTELEPEQASNVNSLALGGNRLLALAGDNGMVFRNDPGETDWTVSNLDNVGIHAGLQADTGVWTGTGWVLGCNLGVFHSQLGTEPWTRFDPGLGPLSWTSFAVKDRHVYAAFTTPNFAVIEDSGDDGANWQFDEVQSLVFVQQLVIGGNALFAARGDGLWSRAIDFASVPPTARPENLSFALGGAQPVHERARLQFRLPEAGTVAIEVFDAQGRKVQAAGPQWWSAGAHEVSLDTRPLPPGIYEARLSAAGRNESLRLVHLP